MEICLLNISEGGITLFLLRILQNLNGAAYNQSGSPHTAGVVKDNVLKISRNLDSVGK
ncbi:hypothetical protein P3S67_014780 [Capsicum chacoense]